MGKSEKISYIYAGIVGFDVSIATGTFRWACPASGALNRAESTDAPQMATDPAVAAACTARRPLEDFATWPQCREHQAGVARAVPGTDENRGCSSSNWSRERFS